MVTLKVEMTVLTIIETYLAIAKAEKYSHTKTLKKVNYISPRYQVKKKVLRKKIPVYFTESAIYFGWFILITNIQLT